MIVAIFRRRLKPGKTFEDFKAASEAEQGFGGSPREVEPGAAGSILAVLKG